MHQSEIRTPRSAPGVWEPQGPPPRPAGPARAPPRARRRDLSPRRAAAPRGRREEPTEMPSETPGGHCCDSLVSIPRGLARGIDTLPFAPPSPVRLSGGGGAKGQGPRSGTRDCADAAQAAQPSTSTINDPLHAGLEERVRHGPEEPQGRRGRPQPRQHRAVQRPRDARRRHSGGGPPLPRDSRGGREGRAGSRGHAQAHRGGPTSGQSTRPGRPAETPRQAATASAPSATASSRRAAETKRRRTTAPAGLPRWPRGSSRVTGTRPDIQRQSHQRPGALAKRPPL